MIEARTLADKALTASLEGKARALAEATGESAALVRRQNAQKWRRADLVWPLFTRGG